MCNQTALQHIMSRHDVELVYATFHVDVGITPFFVAVDHERQKVIISIRGTLSLKDILTDLNAEGEVIPITPPKEDWLGHKVSYYQLGTIFSARWRLSRYFEFRFTPKVREILKI